MAKDDPLKLEPAIKAVIDATNRGDHKGFVDAFAKNGSVNDWGQVFSGRGEIAKWDKDQNTGVQSQLKVTGVSRIAGEVLVLLEVVGNGHNGRSTFAFRVENGKVASLEIG